MQVPGAQLVFIGARYFRQLYAQRVRCDRETPERITKLVDDGIAVERPALHDVLPHMTEHFACLFREPGRCVQQALIVTECSVDRAHCGLLIGVQIRMIGHE